jgi:hypothetical protein
MKLVGSLKDKNYEDRIRRLRGDSTEEFRIFKGIDNLDALKFLCE